VIRLYTLIAINCPFGVSHSCVPMSMAEPSARGNSCSTVPVPKVFTPMMVARLLSCNEPETISAALAVLPFVRITIVSVVSTVLPVTETGFRFPELPALVVHYHLAQTRSRIHRLI